ncbi:hypothetical protein B566_EDAN006280, partial [Ephemera danica]
MQENSDCLVRGLGSHQPATDRAAIRSENSMDTKTYGTNAAEDMDNFYSRCLLCTCRPHVSPHLHISSEAANQLQLAEKINKYLNI